MRRAEAGRGASFDLVPYERVGPIRFGMTRAAVRALFDEAPEPFLRKAESPVADAFKELGIHVLYDAQDRCEAVELWKAEPSLDGKRLLNEPLAKIVEWLRSVDPGLTQDLLGARSPKFGLKLYTDGAADAARATINGVLASARTAIRD